MRKGGKQGKRIDGQAVKMTDRRFLDVAEEFIKVKESMGLKEQTIKTYRWNLKYFIPFTGEDLKYSPVALELILVCIDSMRERGITNINPSIPPSGTPALESVGRRPRLQPSMDRPICAKRSTRSSAPT